ncbi:protein Star-like [Mytilus trossulus]|uniref:protein Star-like n=1 Tax=Mytilus trossulus TaxID=6551 RepID=UPI003004D17E
MDLNAIIKGKGSYKLEHPKGAKQGVISWSQYGQDQVIDKLLKKKKNGFFVEIGGFDGEDLSNTLFFEKVRNWNGLLVEASPFLYDMMLKKDRKCYMVNACVSKSLPAMTFMLAGAITSAKETLTDMHRKRIDRERIQYAKEAHWAHVNDTVKVNCFPLLTIMRTIGHKDIDYFSLDVEGAEMHILNSIEWDDLNIDVFTIETDQHRNEILSFMKQKGYKWIQKLLGDDIFQKIR